MRSARVDVLRGIAILAVLVLHFSLAYNLIDSPLGLLLPTAVLRGAILNGNYGVTVFFVISGFLITSNNLARYGSLDRVRLPHFYGLRAARILPPLLLALAIVVGLALAGVAIFANSAGAAGTAVPSLGLAVLSVLTFWHNVLMQTAGYFNYCLNVYWSLSVEEVFYLCFPLACILLRRRRAITVVCALLIVIAPAYRDAHADDEIYYLYGNLACFDALAIGVLTALFYVPVANGRWIGRPTRAIAAIGLVIVWLIGFDGHEAFGFTLIALGAALLLSNAFAPAKRDAVNPAVRLLTWFGRHSYELYLFHVIVLALFRTAVPRTAMQYGYKLPALALFLGVSAAVAALIARTVAEPANRWLRRRWGLDRVGARGGPPR